MDDVFRRTDGVGQLRHFPSAFRMGKHGNSLMFLSHLSDMRRKKSLMNRAMPFPENDSAIAQLLFRVAPEFLVWIPHGHLVQSKAEVESRVAAQMLVREK